MARLRHKGPGATRLVRDDDLVPMPIMAWGTVHNLNPTEATAARNSELFSEPERRLPDRPRIVVITPT